MNQSLTGGRVVSQALARYGVRTVFAVAGASHTHLLDALDRDGVRIISSRHESGCIGAADGHARVTGGLGVALIIAEQGLPNAANGLATAFHACSPVLVLVARLPGSWTEAQAEQDAAQFPWVGPLTKWARTVPAAERLAEYVDAGAARALAGRRGPTLLQIPMEYLATLLPHPGAAAHPPPTPGRPAADPELIEHAATLLQGAQRPLLIAGAGACHGRAGEALRGLVAEADLPIAGNGLGRGLVPEDGERSFAWPLMQIVAREADVVCVVGARLKQRLGYGLPPRFAPHARFIQIDVAAEELARNRPIAVPIVADAGLACAQLRDALSRRRSPGDSGTARAGWVRAALQPRLDYLARTAAAALPDDAIHPLALGAEIAALMPDDAILVGDGADIQNWMYGALRVRHAPGFLDHYPLGAMGVGTPLAVGAAAAATEAPGPARTVVLVTGDGAFGFHPAELHAAARAGLRLVCIVGNDGAWGTEMHGQVQAVGRALNTELGVLRYDLVGVGFGCHGDFVTRRAELAPALQRAFAHEGPSVVNVAIHPAAGAALKTEPLARMIMFDDLATQLETQHLFAD